MKKIATQKIKQTDIGSRTFIDGCYVENINGIWHEILINGSKIHLVEEGNYMDHSSTLIRIGDKKYFLDKISIKEGGEFSAYLSNDRNFKEFDVEMFKVTIGNISFSGKAYMSAMHRFGNGDVKELPPPVINIDRYKKIYKPAEVAPANGEAFRKFTVVENEEVPSVDELLLSMKAT